MLEVTAVATVIAMAMHGPSRGPFKGLLGTTKGPPPQNFDRILGFFFFCQGSFLGSASLPGPF